MSSVWLIAAKKHSEMAHWPSYVVDVVVWIDSLDVIVVLAIIVIIFCCVVFVNVDLHFHFIYLFVNVTI
jgi:hypothetical protein